MVWPSGLIALAVLDLDEVMLVEVSRTLPSSFSRRRSTNEAIAEPVSGPRAMAPMSSGGGRCEVSKSEEGDVPEHNSQVRPRSASWPR